MATTFGFKAFARRMDVIASQVGENIEDIVRRAAIAADKTVVFATPVDKGIARGGWRVSIGVPSLEVNDKPDTGGGATVSAGNQVISTWREGQGPIFISNNVSYIVSLDKGSSAQAPAGMSDLAIQAARQTLTKANILLAGVR